MAQTEEQKQADTIMAMATELVQLRSTNKKYINVINRCIRRNDMDKDGMVYVRKHKKAEEEIRQLQAELAKYHWIPVEKRPPEVDGPVWLCYEDTGYTYSGYYQYKYRLWQILDPCGGWSDIDSGTPPTHWMPIFLPDEKE